MSFLQLKYFLTAAEEKNISRAAQRLYVSQPALSFQIKKPGKGDRKFAFSARVQDAHPDRDGQISLSQSQNHPRSLGGNGRSALCAARMSRSMLFRTRDLLKSEEDKKGMRGRRPAFFCVKRFPH